MSKKAAKGMLLVLSGPSGVGKSTICRRLLEVDGVEYSVSATTRPPRPGEKDGEAYYFLSREEFEEGIAAGRFLEHAEIVGHLYGTPRRRVEEILAAGRICLMSIDVAGAASVRKSGLAAVFVFLVPPDAKALAKRIRGRGSETPEEIRARLELAGREMKLKDEYDHVVVNDEVGRAVAEILEIVGLKRRGGPAADFASRQT